MDDKVSPYDETTLFCPAGMQQFKSKFKNDNYTGTISNIQSCIRLKDIDEIGDGSHLLYFNMIGLFSFRDKSLEWTIKFWIDFLNIIGIEPDYVTIHPDKIEEWSKLYPDNFKIIQDDQCIWSDGEIGGYCTEFYKNNIEIGNIVNPLGTCIDVGFGLERLEMISGIKSKSKTEILKETILKIIESGYSPTYNKQGSILRKLINICIKDGIEIDHIFYRNELERKNKMVLKYEKLKNKHKDKSVEWWWETHGINIDIM